MATVTPFDATQGFGAWVSWLATATDGAFFVIALAVLFLVVFIPSLVKWGVDWSFFGTSFGIMMIAIPLYFLGGLSEEALAVFIILFVTSIVKLAVFAE